MSNQQPASLRALLAIPSLALLTLSTGLKAQPTVSGFTPDSAGWLPMKLNATTLLTDGFDNGSANGDVTKQSSMAGSNNMWDLVGDNSRALFTIASGTAGGAAAYGWSVRLGDYQTTLAGGQVGLLLSDSNGFFGYAIVFGTGNTPAVDLFRIKPVQPINLSPSGFTFTFGNNLAANNSTALSSGGVLYSYQSAGAGLSTNDAWLTFVIPLAEIRTFTNNSTWTYNDTIGATAFTSGSTNINGKINADYPGTSTAALTFASASGTVATSVPEVPTAFFAGGLILPLAVFKVWRRRRTEAVRETVG